ncbi:3-hydroxyacyl-ACP dehydratase FabZ family protein [Vibrio sp. WXL210]|uniref:3-hydroxyacyl-ACP dehydratase FabZ family protein n=1 Tax=Vibrio sp. WXL210 TaxID=3450709 RepID=UPI003EC55CE6
MDRQLPQLNGVEQRENTLVITLFIQPELAYFKGHFDHFPILPGVVQLDWALHFAAQYFDEQFEFAGMDLVKYQQPIVPSATVSLELEWLRDKHKLQFTYSDDANTYSKGKVKLR